MGRVYVEGQGDDECWLEKIRLEATHTHMSFFIKNDFVQHRHWNVQRSHWNVVWEKFM